MDIRRRRTSSSLKSLALVAASTIASAKIVSGALKVETMLVSVFSELERSRCSASTHSSERGFSPFARSAIAALKCSLSVRPLARRLAQHLADRSRQLGRLEQVEADAEEQVPGLIVEERFRRRAAAVVRKEHLPDRQQVPHPMQRIHPDGKERIPAVAARFLVERREGEYRLAALGAVPSRDRVVLALDVENDGRVGPVEEVRNDHADTFAAAGRRRKHHRQLAGEGEELPSVAADDDARCVGRRATTDETGAADLRSIGEAGVAMQGAPSLSRCNQRERQHDQHADARRRDRADEKLAPARIARVGIPVVDDARELGMARVYLVRQQEEHRREIDGRAGKGGEAGRREHADGHRSTTRPTRHRQRNDKVHAAARVKSSQRASRCRRGS